LNLLYLKGRLTSFILSSCANSRMCPRWLAANVCVYAVWGMGGLKNEAQRNVKPDLLRTVPRDQTTF
jgi:hypothetical protein